MSHFFVLDKNQHKIRCERCFVGADKLQKCTQCGFVMYCSKTCQKDDWRTHKLVCKPLSTRDPDVLENDDFMFFKLVANHMVNIIAITERFFKFVYLWC